MKTRICIRVNNKGKAVCSGADTVVSYLNALENELPRIEDYVTVTNDGTFMDKKISLMDQGFTADYPIPYFVNPFIYNAEFKVHSENYVQYQYQETDLISQFFFYGIGSRVQIFKNKIVVESAIDYRNSQTGAPSDIMNDQLKRCKLQVNISNDTWYNLMCIMNYFSRKIFVYLNGQLLGEVKLGEFNPYDEHLVHRDDNGVSILDMRTATVDIQNQWLFGPFYNWILGGMDGEIEYKIFQIYEPYDSTATVTPSAVTNPFTVSTSSSWS